jgi:uncharacterized membrane protein YuzA (DUF378 family)
LENSNKLALLLLIAGGLNWGLIGLFGFDLVASLFGGFSRIVFILVGWAAIYQVINWGKAQNG